MKINKIISSALLLTLLAQTTMTSYAEVAPGVLEKEVEVKLIDKSTGIKEIQVDGMSELISVTSDVGKVEFTQKGDKAVVVLEGAPLKVQTNPKKESKEVSYTQRWGYNTDPSDTYNYNSGGFKGPIEKKGEVRKTSSIPSEREMFVAAQGEAIGEPQGRLTGDSRGHPYAQGHAVWSYNSWEGKESKDGYLFRDYSIIPYDVGVKEKYTSRDVKSVYGDHVYVGTTVSGSYNRLVYKFLGRSMSMDDWSGPNKVYANIKVNDVDPGGKNGYPWIYYHNDDVSYDNVKTVAQDYEGTVHKEGLENTYTYKLNIKYKDNVPPEMYDFNFEDDGYYNLKTLQTKKIEFKVKDEDDIGMVTIEVKLNGDLVGVHKIDAKRDGVLVTSDVLNMSEENFKENNILLITADDGNGGIVEKEIKLRLDTTSPEIQVLESK